MLVLSQLNRGVKQREEKRPQPSDLTSSPLPPHPIAVESAAPSYGLRAGRAGLPIDTTAEVTLYLSAERARSRASRMPMAAATDVVITYQDGAVGTPLTAIKYTTIIGPVPPRSVMAAL